MKIAIIGLLLVGLTLAKPVTEGAEQLRELPKTELEKTKERTETLITEPLREFVKDDLIGKERVRRDSWEYQLPGQDFKLNDNYVLPSEEYGPPDEEYGPPAEEYGPPAEEYGPPAEPSTTEHYCPEEDIVPPFALAPPAPSALPLPFSELSILRNEYGPPIEEYGPPIEEYGPPIIVATTTTELPYAPEIYYSYPPIPAVIEYGPPAIPDLPTIPPPLKLAPYPAPAPLTTTTEAATLPPLRLAPYPAPLTTTTEAATLPPLKLAPYPAPAPITTTEAATLPPARLAPYPPPALKESPYSAAVESTYERNSGSVEAIPHSVLRYVKPLLLKKKIVHISHPKKLLKRHLLKFFG